MPTDTETMPDSPADILTGDLPAILGDEQDAANADAVLETEEETDETTETAEAEAQAEEGEEEDKEEEEGKGKIDKKLQQRQQDLANREKRLIEATDRLEKLAAKLESNPTAATQKAVEQAQQTQQDALAEAKALLADPSKFDAFEHTPKLVKSLIAVIDQLQKNQEQIRQETTEDRQSRAQAQVHERYWNDWGQKNADIGRARGEQLWAKAAEGAQAEQKAAEADGLALSQVEAAKAVFRRLVKQERTTKGKAPAAKNGETRPAGSGGRLGPTTGRAGNTPSNPRTLEDRVKAGEFNLLG